MTATFDQLSSPRILRGSRADIWVETHLGGTPTAPASGATVVVTDQGGATVASGNATVDQAAKRLFYTLTAAQTAQSAILTATWSNVVLGADPAITLTSKHEVAGDLLFTLAAARAHEEGALKDQNKIKEGHILDARDLIWDAFEDILGYSIGERVATLTMNGNGYEDIWLPQGATTIRSIETREASTWTAFTSDELADCQLEPMGRLTRESTGYWPSGRNNVRVVYESGPIPRELKLAGLRVLRDQLIKSDIPARATALTTERGQFTLSTPGLKGAYFGIPLVDEVLNRYKSNMPGFA